MPSGNCCAKVAHVSVGSNAKPLLGPPSQIHGDNFSLRLFTFVINTGTFGTVMLQSMGSDCTKQFAPNSCFTSSSLVPWSLSIAWSLRCKRCDEASAAFLWSCPLFFVWVSFVAPYDTGEMLSWAFTPLLPCPQVEPEANGFPLRFPRKHAFKNCGMSLFFPLLSPFKDAFGKFLDWCPTVLPAVFGCFLSAKCWRGARN